MVAVNHQGKAEPERTSCGGTRVATVEKNPMCAGQQVRMLCIHTEQMSGGRKSLEIFGLEWRLVIRRRKSGKRRRPGSLLKKRTPFVECLSPCWFQRSSSMFHEFIGYHPARARIDVGKRRKDKGRLCIRTA
jgi:hypothetical protein